MPFGAARGDGTSSPGTPPGAVRRRTDLAFYKQYGFSADRGDPVDRWYQMPCSANIAAVQELLRRYELGADGRVVVDPFCGAGSTLLAAALLGRRSAGCDVDPFCAAVTALKLSAPTLARDRATGRTECESWRYAERVAIAIDRAQSSTGASVLAAIIRDTNRSATLWCADDHAVAWADASHAPEVVRRRFGRAVVDVFCSPPHGTGRIADAGVVSADHLLQEAPQSLVDVRGGRFDHSYRSTSTTHIADSMVALSRCLSTLRETGTLGRVVVEFEQSTRRPTAALDVIDALTTAGVAVGEIVTMYRGAPDGIDAVIDGGLVVSA